MIIRKSTLPISGCLNQSATFCKNGAQCGINGNCICQMFYLGEQCEIMIPAKSQATMILTGISSGKLFVICFMFLVVLPFVLYLVIQSPLLFLITNLLLTDACHCLETVHRWKEWSHLERNLQRCILLQKKPRNTGGCSSSILGSYECVQRGRTSVHPKSTGRTSCRSPSFKRPIKQRSQNWHDTKWCPCSSSLGWRTGGNG